MDLEEITQELAVLGLDEEQASVYVRLLDAGPAKVGNLTHFFEMSRSKLYRVLDQLSEQGIVSKSLEQPTVYEAVPPAKAFNLARSTLTRRIDRLEVVRGRVVDHLETLRTADEGRPEHHWKKLEGTARIYEALHEMAEDAEASLYKVSNHKLAMSTFLPVVEEAWQIAFRRADEDDLDVRFLFDFEGGGASHIPDWVEPTSDVEMRQFTATETVHFALADGEDLLMWVRPAPLGTLGKRDDVAVRTNAPGSVFAHELLFENLWQNGEPVDPGH